MKYFVNSADKLTKSVENDDFQISHDRYFFESQSISGHLFLTSNTYGWGMCISL